MKKRIVALVLTLIVCLTACSKEPEVVVYVQKVGEIVGTGSIAVYDKFAGVVVSENATKVSRDYSRSISMLYVSAGQDVKQGDVLFSYDSEALELEVEKRQLELQRLQQNSTTLQNQITQLQNEMKKASKDDQLAYTINIQEKQAALKENEYSINMKKREIAQTENTLANAQVLAPISGRIISISDENSGSDAYITIQQAGTYRVKASLNELNRGSILVGTQMKISARSDESLTWTGVVSLIDTESGSTGSNENYYGYGVGSEEYTSTTKYPFYIELDSAEGLMLGQHVFVEVDNGIDTEAPTGLMLPAYYVLFESADNADGEKAYVWADNGNNRLEKRTVTLGVFDEMLYAYEIVAGLSLEDYIAFPDGNCNAGVGTTRNPEDVMLPEEEFNDIFEEGMDGEFEQFDDPEIVGGYFPEDDNGDSFIDSVGTYPDGEKNDNPSTVPTATVPVTSGAAGISGTAAKPSGTVTGTTTDGDIETFDPSESSGGDLRG